MKKVFILGGVFAAMALTSCTKDRTCTCTDGTETETFTYENVSKSDAQEACDASDALYSIFGGSCELD